MSEVTASKGVTINLGDYESHRIDASLSADAPPGRVGETLEMLHGQLDAYLIGCIVVLGKARGKERWTRQAIAKRFGLVDVQTGVDVDSDME